MLLYKIESRLWSPDADAEPAETPLTVMMVGGITCASIFLVTKFKMCALVHLLEVSPCAGEPHSGLVEYLQVLMFQLMQNLPRYRFHCSGVPTIPQLRGEFLNI